MMISGALAGLAGAIMYLGVEGNFPAISKVKDIPATGFQGIALSLIAFNSPLGLIGSTMFMGIMANASEGMVTAGLNPHVTDTVMGVVIFLTAVVNFFVMYTPHQKLLT